MRYCTNCGTPTGDAQAYCTECGVPLGQATQPETLTAATDVGPAPAETAPPTETGPNGGTVLPAPASAWPPPVMGTPSPAAADVRRPLPPRRSSGRRITVIAAVAVLVVVLAAGGAAAWKFLGHHAATPAVSVGRTGQSAPGTGPPGSPSAGTPSSSGAASPILASQSPAGSITVSIAPSAGQQPGGQQVIAFLETYFTAINTHNYRLYSSLFDPQLRPTHQQFKAGYRSTNDSDATLTTLSETAAGLAATVTFTSHQDPASSVNGSSCTTWTITLYLQPQGDTYLIVPPPAGYHALYSSCP
jgi:hypothetical protein